MIVDQKDLENAAHVGDVHVQRSRSGQVVAKMDDGNFIFPCADGELKQPPSTSRGSSMRKKCRRGKRVKTPLTATQAPDDFSVDDEDSEIEGSVDILDHLSDLQTILETDKSVAFQPQVEDTRALLPTSLEELILQNAFWKSM